MVEANLEDIWKIMRKHNLELANDISSEYECIICKKILINACTTPCRCLFCYDCIKEYLKDGKKKCPGESRYCDIEDVDITDVQVSRVINKRISELLVNCPNNGCPSKVELKTIEDHLRMCQNQPEICPYLAIGCEDDKLGNNQMKDHLSTEALLHSKLLINWIRNSQNETKAMKNDMEKLQGLVDKLIQDNDELRAQSCMDKENTERQKNNSTEIDILNEEMCALKNANRATKEELKKLSKDNDELKAQIRTSKGNSEEKNNDVLNEEIRSLNNANKSINEELKALKANHAVQISLLNSQVFSQIKQIEKLKQRYELSEENCERILYQSMESQSLKTKMDKISQDCDALKAKTTETAKSIGNIREIIDETIPGQFVWKIDQWAEILKNGRNGKQIEIFSESFSTSKNGYRICLSMRPDFARDDMGIRLSIEKGPSDNVLKWPFDRDLEVSVINPKTGHILQTISGMCSLINEDNSPLQKPKTERNVPFSLFPLKEVLSNPDVQQTNEILIKLSVKPANIVMKKK